jgi:hypothetical protein
MDTPHAPVLLLRVRALLRELPHLHPQHFAAAAVCSIWAAFIVILYCDVLSRDT